MPDLLHGEVDLETGQGPEAPVADPPPAVVDADTGDAVDFAVFDGAADAAAAADPPVIDPAAPPAAKPKRGMLEELIDERKERRELSKRLEAYQNDPVMQRLTPEVRQAIAEGRLVVAPPQANPDAERQRLASVAERYGLFKLDDKGERTPDLETAKRVDAGIRETVREEIAPIQNMTLAQKATHFTSIAIEHATKTMGPEQAEIVREVYGQILAQPNGAQMLSQKEVAETVWNQAVGVMYSRGKLTAAKPVAAKPVVDPAAPPVIPPVTGRRAPQASIQLNPALQRVYKDHGLDPNKTPSAAAMPKMDAQGYMQLED